MIINDALMQRIPNSFLVELSYIFLFLKVLLGLGEGSGSSTNFNCGTNVIESTSTYTICQTIPGETPTPTPGTTVIPVVTQRMTEIPVVSSGTTSEEAQCNPDEVVTGGGYEISEFRSSGSGGTGGSLPPPTIYYNTSFKEFSENNAWHIEIVNPSLTGTVRIYAECLRLVPA